MYLVECVWLPLHVHLGGVTYVGDYHYWTLLTLFQVQGVYGRTALTRGRFLEESRIVALTFSL